MSAALDAVGFDVGAPGDADELHEHTTVRYAPGELTYGQRVARHITGGVVLEEDPSLGGGQVTVVAGVDFTTVHEDPTPVELLPPAPGAPVTTAPPTTEASGEAPPTTLPTGSTTTTPAQVGAVPPDAC